MIISMIWRYETDRPSEARAAEVASRVLRRGFTLAVLGLVIGLGAAWTLAGLLRQMLFGVEPQDPLTLAAVAPAGRLSARQLPALGGRRASIPWSRCGRRRHMLFPRED